MSTASKAVLAVVVAGCIACLPDRATLDCDGDGVVRIVAAGDSNSSPLVKPNWVVSLRRYLDGLAPGRWTVTTVAVPNAGIVAEPAYPALAGAKQVGRILAMRPRADVAILAFGTNDHLRHHSPQEIRDAYREQRTRLQDAGLAVLVALTPPCFLPDACDDAEIAAGNELLRAAWPGGVVDFWSWVDPAVHMDAWGLHFDATGQTARFAAALRTLVAWAPPRRRTGSHRPRAPSSGGERCGPDAGV